MTRALAAAVVGMALVASACAGGDPKAIAGASACSLLAQLAKTGETVAKADVTDPAKFNTTLRSAVDEYVRTARRLRGAVPLGLRADVERLLAAAEQYRFSDAKTARADIDKYAREKCASKS
jgi:hypothetical protein